MVLYMIWRLAIDFWKPEVRIAGFSGIQWACLAMLGYYLGDIRRWIRELRATGSLSGSTATEKVVLTSARVG